MQWCPREGSTENHEDEWAAPTGPMQSTITTHPRSYLLPLARAAAGVDERGEGDLVGGQPRFLHHLVQEEEGFLVPPQLGQRLHRGVVGHDVRGHAEGPHGTVQGHGLPLQ